MRMNAYQRWAMLLPAHRVLFAYPEPTPRDMRRRDVIFVGDILQKDEGWIKMNGPIFGGAVEYVNKLLGTLLSLPLGTQLDKQTLSAFAEARERVLKEEVDPKDAWPEWYVSLANDTGLNTHEV